MKTVSKLAIGAFLSLLVGACAEDLQAPADRSDVPGEGAEVLTLAPDPGATPVTDADSRTRHTEDAPIAGVVADHCTGFCVSVRNGTSKYMWMAGNVGWRLIPPGQWSDDAYPEMEDVDKIEVPGGCNITYQLHTYHQYEEIRIHGFSPYVFIVGSC